MPNRLPFGVARLGQQHVLKRAVDLRKVVQECGAVQRVVEVVLQSGMVYSDARFLIHDQSLPRSPRLLRRHVGSVRRQWADVLSQTDFSPNTQLS